MIPLKISCNNTNLLYNRRKRNSTIYSSYGHIPKLYSGKTFEFGGIYLEKPDEKTIEKLLNCAREARENAYAPYSGFKVGAALLTDKGEIFKGCNVENVSFGATNCAERTALFSAVAAGNRSFTAIAIAAGDETILPCGICRQALSEFSPQLCVICAKKDGYKIYSLSELLPHAFDKFTPEEKN